MAKDKGKEKEAEKKKNKLQKVQVSFKALVDDRIDGVGI
jgi:hypothetical protein